MKISKKSILMLGACALLTVACKKENVNPLENSNQASQDVVHTSKAILSLPQSGPNLLSVDRTYQTWQLHLPTFNFNTNYYQQATTYANERYKGVAAFGNLQAFLYDQDKLSNTEDFIGLTTGHHGKVKYNGSPIEIEEIELLDANMNNMYATRGGQIFRLSYVPGSSATLPYFNASLIYTIPTTPGNRIVSTICPDASLANAFRVYYFAAPNVLPSTFGNFSYVTVSNATTTPIIGSATITTNSVLGGGTSSTVPTINSFRSTLNNSMYVTINGSIKKVETSGVFTNTSSNLIPYVSGGITYQKVDCAFTTF